MSIPLGEKTIQPESVSRGRWTTEEDEGAALRKVVAGNRLLLVEDEALTGMMMSDILTELGFHVIGPFGRVADALAALGREDFHAAVLDVNLDGEMVYPVADAVVARGVPFVFVTGYGAEGIDSRFAQVLVLQKPIEKQMLESIFLDGGPRASTAAIAPQARMRRVANVDGHSQRLASFRSGTDTPRVAASGRRSEPCG
jgi:CheY-like chemotaxis protein